MSEEEDDAIDDDEELMLMLERQKEVSCCLDLLPPALRIADRDTSSKWRTWTRACAQAVMGAAGCTVFKQCVANGSSLIVCCSWRRLRRLQSRSWSGIAQRAQMCCVAILWWLV